MSAGDATSGQEGTGVLPTIVLQDAQSIAILSALRERTELCDASGRVLGVFVPILEQRPVVFRGVKSPYSREEIERRYKEEANDARPLAEFWQEMRQKYPDKFS